MSQRSKLGFALALFLLAGGIALWTSGAFSSRSTKGAGDGASIRDGEIGFGSSASSTPDGVGVARGGEMKVPKW